MTGLRRDAWVRVRVGAAGLCCEVIGTGHRSPVVRRITLSTATALVAGGVPALVVRRNDLPVADQVPARAGARG